MSAAVSWFGIAGPREAGAEQRIVGGFIHLGMSDQRMPARPLSLRELLAKADDEARHHPKEET